MGEYEPNDSRDVTQKDSNTPGEPPRTGPREDAARERGRDVDEVLRRNEREQQPDAKGEVGKQMKQPQQKGRQLQSQSGRSQSQEQGSAADPGSREAGIAQAGKEQLIDQGDPNAQSRGPADTPSTAGGPSTHPSTEEQARSRAAPTGEMNNTITTGPLQGDQPQGIDIKTGDPRPDYDQYETNQPQNMHRDSDQNDAERRRQAASQDGPMGGFAAAPGDAPVPDERGYGGATERREERIEEDEEETGGG